MSATDRRVPSAVQSDMSDLADDLERQLTHRGAGTAVGSRPNLICEKCDGVTGAMSKFSEADRRGWTGPPTIGND